MTNKPLVVHRLARNEASVAAHWYGSRSPKAAERFIGTLAQAFLTIEERPASFPQYLCNTRRCLLKKFPYVVVFFEMPELLLVVAIAHGHRKPGYWRRRLP
jgi:plasmid stabilization system protein ParE